MYNIINFETGKTVEIIETFEDITWIKMQDNGYIACADCTYETADGVMLSDNNTILGIEGRNMQNYTPTVIIQEIPESVVQINFMSGALNDVVAQVNTINEKVNTIYDTQTQGVVLRSELDAAYKEGVNSYAE